MSTVKINCPKCLGTGITGTVVDSVCSQCSGTGLISVSSTDTIASIDTNSTGNSGGALIVTKPVAIPASALKTAVRGK